jgi:hypothetical protein
VGWIGQHYFIINGVIILGLVFYILRRPRPVGGRLRLRLQNPTHAPIARQLSGNEQNHKAKPRQLNVLFNYNGHTWEAYEVLGLPAGSSEEVVERAFETLTLSADKKSIAFLVAAREAIRDARDKPAAN